MIFILSLFINYSYADSIDIVDSNPLNGETTIIYTNDEDEQCKLVVKLKDLHTKQKEIEKWFNDECINK